MVNNYLPLLANSHEASSLKFRVMVHKKISSAHFVDRVHEDSLVPEVFQDYQVLLASQVARVQRGLKATQGLMVSQDLLVSLEHLDQQALLDHRACWGHQDLLYVIIISFKYVTYF